MKKIKINNYDIISEIDVDINIDKIPKLNRTLEDFGGDIGMFNLYLKVESTFYDYRKRTNLNNYFKTSINSLMETIGGPHENKELELMLSGEKPVALLSYDKLINFKPYINKNQLTHVGNVKGFARHKLYIITLPGQEWRGRQIINIFNIITKMSTFPYGKDSIKYHIKLGLLLGYSKEDIKHFIRTRFKGIL